MEYFARALSDFKHLCKVLTVNNNEKPRIEKKQKRPNCEIADEYINLISEKNNIF